jgi:hypothetical protein
MKTPTYFSFTIPTLQRQEIHFYGRYICIQSISGVGVSSLQFALDEDPLSTIFPRKTIDVGDKPYTRIWFYNPAGVSVTIALYVGDSQIEDNGDDASLLAVLNAINTRLAGVAALTTHVRVGPLAVAPAAGTSIVAANASRRRVCVEASLTNVGTVYLGQIAAGCTAADHFAELAAGQSWFCDYYTGAVFGAGTDAADTVVVYEL